MADSEALKALSGHAYISLETFRKNGSGVKTPVWFARVDDFIVVYTMAQSYKVKRLRRNPGCRVAACNMNGREILGDWFSGTATLLGESDSEREEVAYKALRRKYGVQKAIADIGARLRSIFRPSQKRLVMEIRFDEPEN